MNPQASRITLSTLKQSDNKSFLMEIYKKKVRSNEQLAVKMHQNRSEVFYLLN